MARGARSKVVEAARSASCAGAARPGAISCRPSIACAKAGVTTGEWGEVLRQAFGEYRAPTGVARAPATMPGHRRPARRGRRVTRKLGRRPKILVGKPGLDGHSNGAEQVAVRARDAGMDVVYDGIRLTPAEIVDAARGKDVHVVGLSILSGSHMPLVHDVVARLREAGLDDVPVVVGGIIPPEDAASLKDPASPPSTRRRIRTQSHDDRRAAHRRRHRAGQLKYSLWFGTRRWRSGRRDRRQRLAERARAQRLAR